MRTIETARREYAALLTQLPFADWGAKALAAARDTIAAPTDLAELRKQPRKKAWLAKRVAERVAREGK